jgi:hypothetical protein
MSMVDFDEIDKKEWGKLGFFYSHNAERNLWEFYGDKKGLQGFSKVLIEYASKVENASISEHIHLGPHSYLKVITWGSPLISNDGIYGSVKNLKELASIFDKKLTHTSVGKSFIINEEYSQSNKASLIVYVQKDGFDPSSLDDIISKKAQP